MGLLSLSLTFSVCKMWTIILSCLWPPNILGIFSICEEIFTLWFPLSERKSWIHFPSLPCSKGTDKCFGLFQRPPHVTLIWKWALWGSRDCTFWSGCCLKCQTWLEKKRQRFGLQSQQHQHEHELPMCDQEWQHLTLYWSSPLGTTGHCTR